MPFLILLSSLHICPQVPGRCSPRALCTVCGMAYTVRCAEQNLRSMSSNNPLDNTWLQFRLCMEVGVYLKEKVTYGGVFDEQIYLTVPKLL